MIIDSQEFRDELLRLITDKDHKHSCYKDCCDHADDMAVHVYGANPTKILERVRPREDQATKDYRLQSWQPITKSTCQKGISILSKMANPSLYGIRPGKGTEGAALYKYGMEEYPGFKSVVNYFFEAAMQKMLADPNGVFAVRPMIFPKTDVERAMPIIKVYGSRNVWSFDFEHHLIFLRKETTEQGLTIYYFEYYDKGKVVEFTAWTITGKEVIIDETKRYVTNFEKVPVWPLMGLIESLDDGSVMFRSFFDAAAPFWNEVVNHWSDMKGALVNHIHPLRVEASVGCDYVNDKHQVCTRGVLIDPDSGARTPCPSCAGSGVKGMANSPFSVIRVNVDQYKNEANGNISGIAPVSYVNVPTDATQMLKEHCYELLEMGLNALNMDVVNKIGENQSGRAKVIDRGELYDFLYKIASVVFDTHISNFFYFFNAYMFKVEAESKGRTKVDDNLPEISKPVQFDISTAQELLAEFDQAKKAGANPDYLKVKQKEINGKEWATYPELRDKMNLILDCDPFPTMAVTDLELESANGWVNDLDVIIHFNVSQFVDRALLENKQFAKMPSDQRKVILTGYAKEIQAANRQKLEQQQDPDEKPDPAES